MTPGATSTVSPPVARSTLIIRGLPPFPSSRNNEATVDGGGVAGPVAPELPLPPVGPVGPAAPVAPVGPAGPRSFHVIAVSFFPHSADDATSRTRPLWSLAVSLGVR